MKYVIKVGFMRFVFLIFTHLIYYNRVFLVDSLCASEEQKQALAAQANLKEDQVSKWFVNTRKRNWRPLSEIT